MKYIKFFFTRGDTMTLPEDKALAVLNSPDTLIKILDAHGEWTGDTIHKSHIVQTVRDKDAEREQLRKNPRLEGPQGRAVPDELRALNRDLMKKYRPRFVQSDSGIWTKNGK